MKDFGFYLDQWGVQEEIYTNRPGLNMLEKQIMEKALSEITAGFLQEFGTEGKFELKFIRQKIGGKGARYVSGTRPVYKIVAADAKTGAILKAHPKWLEKYSKNARL